MSREISATIIVLSILTFTACTSDGVKRGIYDGLYQRQCLDNAKMLDCDPKHMTYDQYERERRDAQKQNDSTNAPVK